MTFVHLTPVISKASERLLANFLIPYLSHGIRLALINGLSEKVKETKTYRLLLMPGGRWLRTLIKKLFIVLGY